MKEVFRAASSATGYDNPQVEIDLSTDDETTSDGEGLSRPRLERFYTAPESLSPQSPIQDGDELPVTIHGSTLTRPAPMRVGLPKPGSDMDWLFTDRRRLTPRQKQRKKEFKKDQDQVMKKRVKTLGQKLIERLRPIVNSDSPDEPNDMKTITFRKNMEQEADDLKLESFGVEVS